MGVLKTNAALTMLKFAHNNVTRYCKLFHKQNYFVFFFFSTVAIQTPLKPAKNLLSTKTMIKKGDME